MKQNIFKALIVDDERLARKELISMLAEFPEIKIAGEASEVSTAQKLIIETEPDVIFLDIQMPGESGFDLIDSIPIETKIIFVTAFDEYAIRAFDVNALDYLLKPVNPKRMKEAIDRLKSVDRETTDGTKKLVEEDRLLLAINNKLQFIKVSSIICISAAGDYTEIQTSNGIKGVTLKSLKEWEFRLPEKLFIRIHRSTIINLDSVDKFEEWFNNSYRVYLNSIKEPFTISRRYSSKLKDRFS